MRNRSSVLDVAHFYAGRCQSADGGFATGTGAADAHFDAAHTMIARHAGGVLRRLLRGKRSAFTRSAKTQRTGTLPGQNIARLIGDGHNGVIERSLDVGNAERNVLPLFLFEGFLLALFIRRRCSGFPLPLLVLLVLPY